MSIQVYIRSIGYNRKLQDQINQIKFVAWEQAVTHLPEDGWEDRILDPENSQVMQVLSALLLDVRKDLQIIDTGCLIGRLKAWIKGVDQIPMVMIDKIKTSGVFQIRQVFQNPIK
jgi:hypothetical protein